MAIERETVAARPVVSVIVLTYNHERFIADALAGVFAQATPFAVEVIVADDCSTDGNLDVIDLARAGRPVTVLASPVNLCSNVTFRRALEVARGEFVATLDGDDYWTDTNKLARQVAFLRAHPDHAMCFHDVEKVDDITGEVIETTTLGTAEISRCDLLTFNEIPGCSAVIRRTSISRLPPSFDDAEFGDWPLYLEAARHGRIAGVGATMGVYRLHAGGTWSGAQAEGRYRQMLRFLDGVDRSTRASCRSSWRRGRGFAMRKVAEALLDDGRRWRASILAARTLALPGPAGHGRRMSARLVARSVAPRLAAGVQRWRHRLAAGPAHAS